jgi:hypothetical protein
MNHSSCTIKRRHYIIGIELKTCIVPHPSSHQPPNIEHYQYRHKPRHDSIVSLPWAIKKLKQVVIVVVLCSILFIKHSMGESPMFGVGN